MLSRFSYITLLFLINLISAIETKLNKLNLDKSLAIINNYESYWSFCHSNKSYSGVCVYSNLNSINAEQGLTGNLTNHLLPIKPLNFDQRVKPITNFNDYSTDDLIELNFNENHLNFSSLDNEGRTLIIDFNFFVLINVYCPAESDDRRNQYKQSFHQLLLQRLKSFLDEDRNVILIGDINVAHRPIDHCDGLQLTKTDDDKFNFFNKYTRLWFDNLLSDLKSPMIDVLRYKHPNRQGMFTCWNTLINARPSNYGTRIDYILVSNDLLNWVDNADILPNIYGSDHCPVYLDLKNSIIDPDNNQNIIYLKDKLPNCKTKSPTCSSNWDEFNGKQTTLSSFLKKSENPSNNTSNNKTNSNNLLTFSASPTNNSYFTPKQKQKQISSSVDNDDDNNDSDSDIEIIEKNQIKNQKSKQKWKEIMAPKLTPKCNVHNEHCKEYTVNKNGPNKGKRFWLCSRNVGPSYNNEGNKADAHQYRCNFFIWSSSLKRDLSYTDNDNSNKKQRQ